jgi:hypothetical protein
MRATYRIRAEIVGAGRAFIEGMKSLAALLMFCATDAGVRRAFALLTPGF